MFRNKRDKTCNASRNKAKLVVNGYSQEEGIDNDVTYAPVAWLEAIYLHLTYACYYQ